MSLSDYVDNTDNTENMEWLLELAQKVSEIHSRPENRPNIDSVPFFEFLDDDERPTSDADRIAPPSGTFLLSQ